MKPKYKKFLEKGHSSFPKFLYKKLLKKLYSQITKTRNFKDIFVSQKYFLKNQKYKGTNPRPGRNLAEN